MYKYPLISLLTLFTATATAQIPVGQHAVTVNPVVDNPLQVAITEWSVPWKDTRPRDPDVAPNGVIWLVGQGGDYAARFDPATGEFRRKDLPSASTIRLCGPVPGGRSLRLNSPVAGSKRAA